MGSAAELPYFEGDFWPNVLEESIKELDQEEEEKRKQAEAAEAAAAANVSCSFRINEKQFNDILCIFASFLALLHRGQRGQWRWEEKGPEEGQEVEQVEGRPTEEQQKVQRTPVGQRSLRQDLRHHGEAQGSVLRHPPALGPVCGQLSGKYLLLSRPPGGVSSRTNTNACVPAAHSRSGSFANLRPDGRTRCLPHPGPRQAL